MTREVHAISYKELIRGNRNFRNLWLGQIISLMGDWFNLIATAILTANLTGSGLAVGGLFVVRSLAQFLSSPLGGVLADRFNRKKILILADILRFFIVLGFLFIKDASQIWLLYTLTALQLGISGIFFPTKNAILPDVVSEEGVGTANALSATTWSTMLAMGAFLGGQVAGKWGIAPAIWLDAFSYLLSAYFIRKISYTQTTAKSEEPLGLLSAFRLSFQGFGYLSQNREILIIAIQKASIMLAVSGFSEVIQVELSSKFFVIGEGGSTSLGWLYAVVGVGTGISPIIARWFTGDREVALRRAIATGYIITLIGLLLMYPLTDLGLVLVGSFFRGFGIAIIWVFSTTLLLKKLPNEVRGRVFGTEFAFLTLSGAIGSGLGGWLLGVMGLSLQKLILLMGVLVLIFGVNWLFNGVLRSRKLSS
ncbi:MAG: MFS transporter [Anaerolineae bacterium]|nr:MFS transporter [Anaerolineae bacterium]MBT7781756.1 MFS transporter [Anaerolineae bacterium]